MTGKRAWHGHLHGYAPLTDDGDVLLDTMIDEPGPHFQWAVLVTLTRAEQVDLAVFLLTQILKETEHDHE